MPAPPRSRRRPDSTRSRSRPPWRVCTLGNGKTPIVRFADVKKYQSVAAIDLPGTRALFDEILAHRADVFETESVEAIIQQRLKPGLCCQS